MKSREAYLRAAEQDLLHVYHRYNVLLESGKGVYLFDQNGKKYLDFAAGIGVCALGYGNEEFQDAIKKQIDNLIHTSNLYYNRPIIEAAERLKKAAAMDRVFFTNSGAEAIEGAIKAAKKYAYTKDGTTDHEIVAMRNSFHGRSLGALSVTGNESYRAPFEPLIGGVRFGEFGNLDSIKSLVGKKTCAILMETIQGEGGVYPVEETFFQGVAEICKENDILLILDEIQCGMGRSGTMFAWQRYGAAPDIMTTAKALGNGVPVGAFLTTERVAEQSLAPGDHGTTYGGNPLAGAAVSKTLEIMERDNITEHVQKIGDYLWNRLEQLKEKHACVLAHRGLGLMQGLKLHLCVSDVVKKALERNVILLTAGSNVLRFLPPLIVEERHVDEMFDALDHIFAEMES